MWWGIPPRRPRPGFHGRLPLCRGLRASGPTGIERRGHVRVAVRQGPEDGRCADRVSRPPLRQDASIDDRGREADEFHAASADPRGIHEVHGDALTGRDVRDDRDGLRLSPARRFLGANFPLLPTFPFLRRTFHVQAEDPGRSAPHDHLDDRMAARVAPLLGRDDEAALGERVRIVARRILRAAHATLPVGPVPDHPLPISALFAAADEVLLADRWTVGRDAITRRPPAVGMFDHGRAAFRAVFLRALDDSDLRQWVGVPTRGVPGAAEEAAPAPGPEDRKSTRLNSSHVRISYAVFCLKKKKRSRRSGGVNAPLARSECDETAIVPRHYALISQT